MGTFGGSAVSQLINTFWMSDRLSLARYLVAGVAVSVGYTVTIVALVSWKAWVSPETANVISLILWTIVSYFVHRGFTFRYEGEYGDSLVRFGFVFALKLIASLFVIIVVTKYRGESYFIGVVVNWLVLPMVSYLALKIWVFQRRLLHGVSSPWTSL